MPVYVPNPDSDLSPSDLFDEIGAAMSSRYGAAEAQMIERIRNLAVEGIEIPPSYTARLETLRQLREEGERIAAELSDPQLAASVIEIAARDGEAAAIARLGIVGGSASAITPAAANAVAGMTLDLSNRLDDMSARITRWMPDAYQRVISLVAPNVILGVETLAQAQRTAAEQFLARGVRGFTDAAGKEWRIGTYAEMATRTSVNRAWMDANIEQQQRVGINLVTIVIGVNACKVCAAHAGKIYSTDGTPAGVYDLAHSTEDRTVSVTVAGTLAEARAQGWNHPNCRCVVVAYFPGLSIVGGSTYDAQKEKDRDRLRELERRVRDLKRKEVASFDDLTAARYRRRIRDAQADIRDHIRETGLLRRNYREQLAFSDGRGAPQLPAAPKPRPIAPPRAPVPLETLAQSRTRAALTTIDEAGDVAQVGELLASNLGVKVTGFDSNVSLASTKEAARALVTMRAKYPALLLNEISVAPLLMRGEMVTIARFDTNYDLRPNARAGATVKTVGNIEVRMAPHVMNADARPGFLERFAHATDTGHVHKTDDEGIYYSMIHEIGHVMHYSGDVGAMNRKVTSILKSINDPFSQASIYGRSSRDELVAEAFADVELNGASAQILSIRIHEALLELLGKAAR